MRTILTAGAAFAEKAADDTLAASWTKAKGIWGDRASKAAIDAWQRRRDQVKPIDDQLWALIQQGEQPVMLKSTAVDIRFLDDETSTSKYASVVTRDLLFVRPADEDKAIRMESGDPPKLAVAKGSAPKVYGRAAVCALTLEGKDTVSGSARDVEIRAFAGQESVPAKTMSHTNIDYCNLQLARTNNAVENKSSFAYDDFKVEGPSGHLLIYVRGQISPAVTRYAAFRNLRDNLRIEIPDVDDSHKGLARPYVTLLPRRPALKNTTPNKKEATIEFAEKKRNGLLDIGFYNGEQVVGTDGPGVFVTYFAYSGLPRLNSDFGEKVIRFHGESVVNVQSVTAPIDTARNVRYLYQFEVQTHPKGFAQIPAAAADSLNGLWYCSEEAKGTTDACVPGFRWKGIVLQAGDTKINPKIANLVVVWDTSLRGRPNTIASAEKNRGTITVTFYHDAIKLFNVRQDSFGYAYNQQLNINVLKPTGELDTVMPVQLAIAVPPKHAGAFLAHVWRHELRHGEQDMGLAKSLSGGEQEDNDGDYIWNLLEKENKTSATTDRTWCQDNNVLDFPVSWDAAKLDREVDSELRAMDQYGNSAVDWGMYKVTKDGVEVREGVNWRENQ